MRSNSGCFERRSPLARRGKVQKETKQRLICECTAWGKLCRDNRERKTSPVHRRAKERSFRKQETGREREREGERKREWKKGKKKNFKTIKVRLEKMKLPWQVENAPPAAYETSIEEFEPPFMFFILVCHFIRFKAIKYKQPEQSLRFL